MTQLAVIEEEISNILAVAEELTEDQQEVALEYLEELGVQEMEKIDAVGYAVRKRKAEIEFLKEEERRIRNRRQSMERRLDEFREYLSQIFQREGIQQIRGLKSAAYIRKVSSVEITDLNLLPSEFVETRIDFIPRKALIKEQLKNGEEVPGARMAERHSLVIN
jgi:hypothetical protein